MIRKAREEDVAAVAAIYDELHDAEERGDMMVGWQRGVYPTEETARSAYERGELFVEDDGRIVAAAIINGCQVDAYAGAAWRFPASPDEVMVLHTLVVSPSASGRGYGKAFVAFYEAYAAERGCRYLRMDTNERNLRARAMYKRLGYEEIGIVPTVFNGIEGVGLVLLEKAL